MGLITIGFFIQICERKVMDGYFNKPKRGAAPKQVPPLSFFVTSVAAMLQATLSVIKSFI
jgi:hypothetical protein